MFKKIKNACLTKLPDSINCKKKRDSINRPTIQFKIKVQFEDRVLTFTMPLKTYL